MYLFVLITDGNPYEVSVFPVMQKIQFPLDCNNCTVFMWLGHQNYLEAILLSAVNNYL